MNKSLKQLVIRHNPSHDSPIGVGFPPSHTSRSINNPTPMGVNQKQSQTLPADFLASFFGGKNYSFSFFK
jgi:hypothetical protein